MLQVGCFGHISSIYKLARFQRCSLQDHSSFFSVLNFGQTCSEGNLELKQTLIYQSLFRDANDHVGLPALASFPAICSVCLPHTQPSSLHTNTPLCPNFSTRLDYEEFCKISLRPPQSFRVHASVPTTLQLLFLQYIYHLFSSCERKGKHRRKTLLFVDVFSFWLSLFFFRVRGWKTA